MNDFINQISIYVLLFLPQIAIISMAIGIGLGVCILSRKTEDFYQYYTKPERYYDSKRNIFDVLSGIVSIIYTEGMIISFILIFSFALYNMLGLKSQRVFISFSDISTSLPQELLSWLAVIITLVAMLVAFRKEYYLVFSVADVLEQYKFKKRTLSILNLMIIVKIFDFGKDFIPTQPYNTAFRIVIIITYIRAIVLCVYLIHKVMNILYSQEKMELKLLDKLYNKVRNKLLISSACYNENVAGTLINCNYLCEKHMVEFYKIRKNPLRNIQLQSVHKEGLEKVFKNVVKLIARKVNRYLLIISAIYILIFVLAAVCVNNYLFGILRMIFISWVSWGTLFFLINCIQSKKCIKIKQVLNRLFFSDYIYLNKDNDRITSIFGFGIPKESEGYLRSILNIAIYWKITLSGESEKNIEAFRAGLKENRGFYIDGQKEFDEIILPLCYFIEYISLTGDKTSFRNELCNETWLDNINNKQNRKLFEELSFYICALGNRNSISQKSGEYFAEIKKICTERKKV